MKKSFMTRALATGLSLAMAFSLTAVSNVSTASAAADPAMNSKTMTVKVGQSKNFKATKATRSDYKIVKTKMSKAGKTKADVSINKGGKSIKVTGKAATKKSNLVITFKNRTTKEKTTVTTKVVVKAVDEAYRINSAEATGVKTITVTLNKAVADATAVKATVKKGAANRGCKATVDGATITLAMTAKLIAGDYDVTISGVADTDLTATVNVAKDETLTSFYIGENLIQTATNASSGCIYYAALNQYGEKMNAGDPTPNCTFGETSVADSATADAYGKIEVKNIPSILAIQGTTGTLVLVDNNTGVNATATVTFSNPATASEVEIVGFYNANKSIMQDITEQDNPGSFKLLMNVKDQYGNSMEAADLVGVIATIAGGLTNVDVDTNTETDEKKARSYFSDVIVNGTTYVAVSLKDACAKAGSFSLTMVNSNKGLLLTQSFEVAEYVVVKSVKISADKGLYNAQDNELTYEITDADGNSVTSYAVLKSTVNVMSMSNFASIRWEKQADGTAKLIAKPSYSFTNANNDKETTLGTFTMSANSATSSDYMVNTFTLTISEERFVDGIAGIDSSVGTTVSAVSDAAIDLAFDKIVYADQYGNEVTKANDASIYPDGNLNVNAATTGGITSGCSVCMEENDYFVASKEAKDSKYQFKSTGLPGSATVYLKYFSESTAAGKKLASVSNYDKKFIISSVNTGGVDVSTLKIASINDGYAFQVASDKALSVSAAAIKVTAMMGGTEVTIPTSQYVVKGCDNNKISKKESTDGVSEKTATVTIVVSTYDNNNIETATTLTGEYKISTKDQEISKICAVDDSNTTVDVTSAAGIVTKGAFEKLFKYDDQYGIVGNKGASAVDSATAQAQIKSDALDGITYTINVLNGNTKTFTTAGEGTNSASVTFAQPGTYEVKVTATLNGTSKTQTLKVVFR